MHNNMRTRIGLVLLFFIFIFLNGCSHVARQDGPPNFYVDETKVPNATPKVEHLSKYGNYHSYRVFGKRYYTMKSSKNYQERGIASWYGSKFHQQRTSSGERYDMLAMTAAHKTLPLPTYVEVTNLKNHRKIIVKVNDRGPFEGSRLIDLSYVAAKKLGMLGHGTTNVLVKAIDPRDMNHSTSIQMAEKTERINKHKKPDMTFAEKNTANQTNHQHVYLQVGVFRQKSNAENLQRRVQSITTAPVMITKTHQFYRVQIGPIQDLADVDSVTEQLKSMGLNSKKLA